MGVPQLLLDFMVQCELKVIEDKSFAVYAIPEPVSVVLRAPKVGSIPRNIVIQVIVDNVFWSQSCNQVRPCLLSIPARCQSLTLTMKRQNEDAHLKSCSLRDAMRGT